MDNEDFSENRDQPEIELKPYYVYELRDPTNGNAVFYVGKGTRRRIQDHEREANLTEEPNSEKIKRIKDIKAKGCDPTGLVIARFDTEDEAYAVETVLMHWVHGFPDDANDSGLTNVQAGHGHIYIRPKGNLDRLGQC